METHIQLLPIQSSYRCLRPKVSDFHEKSIQFVHKMVAGFNFSVVHKKGKENSNADALSQSEHMGEALPLEEDKYPKFYKVIKFEGNAVWRR